MKYIRDHLTTRSLGNQRAHYLAHVVSQIRYAASGSAEPICLGPGFKHRRPPPESVVVEVLLRGYPAKVAATWYGASGLHSIRAPGGRFSMWSGLFRRTRELARLGKSNLGGDKSHHKEHTKDGNDMRHYPRHFHQGLRDFDAAAAGGSGGFRKD